MAVSAEHLEHEERDVLPVWLPGWSRRKELGRQWCAFVAAWKPDATFAPLDLRDPDITRAKQLTRSLPPGQYRRARLQGPLV